MNIFSFLKQNISILDVVQEYTTLKKAGSYFKGTCPFHSEKTASFTVSPHKEIFYCFGCHASGDTIGFIAKIEHCSQLEAAQYLMDRYQIELPESLKTQHQAQTTPQKERYFELCKLIATWTHQQLLKHTAARNYIRSRGFTDETLQQFMVGYFPSGTGALKLLISQLQKEHFLVQDLLEAHLITQSHGGYHSSFEERILFPIKDAVGRFCGFGGRIYKPQDTRPKYYNSKENTHFAKGSLLFGLDIAKSAIQKSEIVFLVEGYTDCLAMAQHGYQNTVATLGTSCTHAHLKTLSRYAHCVFVLYDGDSAGQQAILKLTQLCWEVNMELKVIKLPGGEDPASFLQKEKNLNSLLGHAQDIFDFFVEHLGTDFTSKPFHQKLELVRTILETIEPLQDPLKQDLLLQKTAKLSEIPFESLKKEMLSLKPAPQNLQDPPEIPITPPDEGSLLEKRLFCAILETTSLCKSDTVRSLIGYMPGMIGKILQKLLQHVLAENQVSFASFFDTLPDDEKRYVSSLLIKYEGAIDEASVHELLLQFHKRQWKLIVRDIQARLVHAKNENNQQEVQRIMQDFLLLKQKIMLKPSSPKPS